MTKKLISIQLPRIYITLNFTILPCIPLYFNTIHESALRYEIILLNAPSHLIPSHFLAFYSTPLFLPLSCFTPFHSILFSLHLISHYLWFTWQPVAKSPLGKAQTDHSPDGWGIVCALSDPFQMTHPPLSSTLTDSPASPVRTHPCQGARKPNATVREASKVLLHAKPIATEWRHIDSTREGVESVELCLSL